MGFEDVYDPIGDTVTLSVLVGVAVSLTPGQYVTFTIHPGGRETAAAGAAVTVTNYGHGVRIVEIHGPPGHPDGGAIGAEALTERGFTPPSGNPRLVGDPQAWQWPFGVHWAAIAAEQVLWALEEIRASTHGRVTFDITAGNLTDGGLSPNSDNLTKCLPEASLLSEGVAL